MNNQPEKPAFQLPPMTEEEFLVVRKQHILTIAITVGAPILLLLACLQFGWFSLLIKPQYTVLAGVMASVIICRKLFPRAIRAYTWRYRHYKNGRGWRNGTGKP